MVRTTTRTAEDRVNNLAALLETDPRIKEVLYYTDYEDDHDRTCGYVSAALHDWVTDEQRGIVKDGVSELDGNWKCREVRHVLQFSFRD